MSGTSLEQLQQKENMERLINLQNKQQPRNITNGNYASMQNLQYAQGRNTQHAIHQNQHTPYVTTDVRSIESNNIGQIAQDINDGLIDDYILPESDTFEEKKSFFGKLLEKLPTHTRDPIIILILFVILSQPLVKNYFTRYIKQLRPINGNTSTIGIFIYGSILAGLYYIIKSYLI